jgi:signal transduction histidine kinase
MAMKGSMAAQPTLRVHVASGEAEGRRLVARLSRAGMSAGLDDGATRADLLIVLDLSRLAEVRERADVVLAVGAPAGPLFTGGADDVVPPGEPELLFRRVVWHLEHKSQAARIARAEERARTFEEALAEAAHDMRSPLHAALGHASLLANDEGLNDDQRASGAASARQIERALHIAEQVLSAAVRAQRVPLKVKPVDVSDLIEAAVAGAQATSKVRGVRVSGSKLSERMRLRADPDLLSRLLDNLVANAIKHTPRGGEVEVAAVRSGPRAVRLCVRDTGQGIPASELHKLTAGLGAGRGLRICREIAERHGGDLWAESVPGKGSRFIAELPMQVASTRPKVLLVSDDNRWVRGVALALRHACDVRTAGTADATLGARRPDLVLVESLPPGQERKYASLRTEAEDAKVPVVELPADVAAARLASALARLAS